MRYTDVRVQAKHTVNLGNYESASFEVGLMVDIRSDDGERFGLDPDNERDKERFIECVRRAFQDAAQELSREEKRFTGTVTNSAFPVSIEARKSGKIVGI